MARSRERIGAASYRQRDGAAPNPPCRTGSYGVMLVSIPRGSRAVRYAGGARRPRRRTCTGTCTYACLYSRWWMLRARPNALKHPLLLSPAH